MRAHGSVVERVPDKNEVLGSIPSAPTCLLPCLKIYMGAEIYHDLINPVLNKLDSETWHVRAREALHVAESTPLTLKLLEQFAYNRKRFTDRRLNVIVGGIELDNPVMVGAGWDKAGRAVHALYQLGFSGTEVGTVLEHEQPGNDKPRQFMIGQGVALNRLGFNSPGMDVVSQNLERYTKSNIPIGISVGKNKEIEKKDTPRAHAVVVQRLYDQASYFAINVSSPNTPGLRELQEKDILTDIVQEVNGTMDQLGKRKPVFVKIAPDLENGAIDDVIRVVADNNLAGIIATNTTTQPELKAQYGEQWRNEAGGLSGDNVTYRRMVNEKIAHIFKETRGEMEIIGVGGVKDADTALEKIRAGAKVVQLVTAIRGVGPTVPGRINRGLIEYMRREGVRSVSTLVGSDHPNRLT